MKKKKFWLLLLLIFLMGSILFGAYYLTRAELLRRAEAELPKLYVFVWPQIGEVGVGEEFAVEIRVNSPAETVRRIDYLLDYDQDRVRPVGDSAEMMAASWAGEVKESATIARLEFAAIAKGMASFNLRVQAPEFTAVTNGAEIEIK